MASFVENVNKVAALIPAESVDLGVVVDNIDNINLLKPVITDLQSIVNNVVPNIAEILLADDNAATATTKAGEASTSASQALGYRNEALGFRNEAEAFNESKAFVVDTVEDLLTIPSSYVTAVVRDLNRGGTFIWSAAGTANGGTVFAGATGYWNRQYSGAVNVKWFGVYSLYTKYTQGSSSLDDNNVGLKNMTTSKCSILMLGDSISEGIGASQYTSGFAYSVPRAIYNNLDKGNMYKDSGYGYHSIINAANLISSGEISTTGTISTNGAVTSRIVLAAGETITISGKSINYLDVIYDAGNSTGTSLTFALDGVTIRSHTLTGTGLYTSFNGAMISSQLTKKSSSMTITAVGGSVEICTVLYWKHSLESPITYIMADSGKGYQTFTTSAAMDEMAYYLNLYRTTQYMMLNLGTNNIYNAGLALTPAEYIAEVNTLISGMNTRCSNIKYFISVPPKAVETKWPIIKTGFTYEDYVYAILNYAEANNHTVIRHDLSVISKGNFYADGVHPNNQGHKIMADTICGVLGIPIDYRINTDTDTIYSVPMAFNNFLINNFLTSSANAVMNDKWLPFMGNSAFRAVATKQSNIVTLSGIVSPNGSVSTHICTLPVGYRPIGRTVYILAAADGGAVAHLNIDIGGNILISTTIPTTWLSLDNISFTISRV